MLAIVAPGQGAQTPGFLSPWLAESAFEARLQWLSTVANLDLVHYGTEADAETIRDTAIAQPLLVAAGLLAALELFPSPADGFRRTGVGAGHSVGEITAAAASGVLTAEQAMVFVRERGKAMAEASALQPTGMSAVIGGDADEVLAAIDNFGLTPANNNGKGQIVAAGPMELLAKLAENAPAKARVRPLSVAGAFHTSYMQPGKDHLAKLAGAISTHDPRTALLSNADGQVVQSGHEFLRRLVDQVTLPVRWDLCMQTMTDLGVTGLLELPPAKTLTGIAKRNMSGVELFSLNTPDDLPAARAFVEKHSDLEAHHRRTPNTTWTMVVSPAKGEFAPADDLGSGATLEPGAVVGAVANLRESVAVHTEHGGQITEWLVEPGDIVSPGQPLVRLYPAPEGTE
ncbi:acyltransferase domain-containing protein [Nigerium massiliense]|uniref:acyltransferase domain-containing protein n=1 Tax=Nigerium massiliense TaxID=1522317 RepID=UPI00058B8DDB|nr:acyltransferase domain-containing protein [Nigerium massiliense]